MRRYLWRSLQGHLATGRLLTLLTVAGVALGVASVAAIQTLNQGALGAFAGSVRAVSGGADLTLTGATPDLPERWLTGVLGDPEVAAAWPLTRVRTAVGGQPGLYLEVIGFDVFAPSRYRLAAAAGGLAEGESVGGALAAALARPGWTAVTPELAAERGWSLGDTVTVSSGSRQADLVIGALVDFRSLEPLAPRGLAVMDIAQAQSLLGRRGRLQQIDIQLVPGTDAAAVAARLQRRLGAGARLQTPQQRQQDTAALLAAFRLNLTALSLISVFVGLFLVLASVQASLVRRRAEFGLLRSLGTTRRQVLGLVLAEAAVLGVLGVACGLPLGLWIARQNLAAVSGTLTSIYLLESLEQVRPTALGLGLGALVGLAGALGGAVLPAVDMARRDTASLLAPWSLHRRAGRLAAPLAGWALLQMTAGGLWFLAWGHGHKAAGFVLGFVMLVSLPLLVPLLISTLTRPLRPHGLGPVLSLKNLGVRLQTTSFAVAALAVTVSMMIGITLLIASFRATLVNWLDVTIRADVYVSTESWERSGDAAFLAPGLVAAWAALPQVAGVETQRRLRVRTSGDDRPVWLNGVDFGATGDAQVAARLPLVSGDPGAAARRLLHEGAAIIGEPLARKAQLAPGDTLRLAGPAGAVALPIAGVMYDYTSEGGSALVTLATLVRHFGPTEANNAALFLWPGGDPEALIADLRERYAGSPLVFRSNRALRTDVLAIFDQTFAITRTLQGMALLIAVCAVSLTLLIQARERAGELALLRALGATRRQIFLVLVGEGTGLGLCGLILGLGGGLGLAALLIGVINRDWFGWTLQPVFSPAAIAGQAAVILLAAAAASLVPALRAGLTAAGQLSRDDL